MAGVGNEKSLAQQSDSRRGTTLIESIVVLFIIAALLAILLPAVQRSRISAMDATCKNNLRQLVLAMRQYSEVRKKLPEPAQANIVSGWAIEILPFMEERLLATALAGKPSIHQPSIVPLIVRRPRIMTCPLGWEDDRSIPSIPTSHYGFVPFRQSSGFELRDLPSNSRVAWVQSPEVDLYPLPQDEGPHYGGFHIANGEGGVSFYPSSGN